ncbi:hypothetical protein DSO57_1031088 [Entomophthora muscae]|uniref:Uncharacterized protein n=1 Tax=Entomophthora muscae TaxID=34485 RepID=A0ACC2UKK9_9FUNG|nr:hypothetical protein DSO57_1031088 [Entomophthora muscae]
MDNGSTYYRSVVLRRSDRGEGRRRKQSPQTQGRQTTRRREEPQLQSGNILTPQHQQKKELTWKKPQIHTWATQVWTSGAKYIGKRSHNLQNKGERNHRRLGPPTAYGDGRRTTSPEGPKKTAPKTKRKPRIDTQHQQGKRNVNGLLSRGICIIPNKIQPRSSRELLEPDT